MAIHTNPHALPFPARWDLARKDNGDPNDTLFSGLHFEGISCEAWEAGDYHKRTWHDAQCVSDDEDVAAMVATIDSLHTSPTDGAVGFANDVDRVLIAFPAEFCDITGEMFHPLWCVDASIFALSIFARD